MDFEQIKIKSGDNGDCLLRIFYSEALPKKREWREHHHTELEISLVKEGQGVYTVGAAQYTIKPGDVFLFGTHEEHYITDISGCERLRLMNIHFEPRFIWAGSDLFDVKYLRIFFDRSENFRNRLDRENPATSEIVRLLVEIEREAAERREEYELMVKIKLLCLLVLLNREYDYVSYGDSYLESAKYSQISGAMKYIDENLAEPLTLDEIAARANLNKTYFTTLFKKLNGVTPWEYLTARRIEKSYSLLSRRDMNILEVANSCGFNNASNFNRAFRKLTGMTPSEYRTRNNRS